MPVVREGTPLVELRGITVRFGNVAALDGVDLRLTPGERHAVVGENGAGKSTLMKVLFGLLEPAAGEVWVGDVPRRFRSPADAIALGIGMVQQHFELIPSFTVAENILLGAEVRGAGGMLDRASGEAAVRALAERSGLPIDPSARVGALSVAAQQRVEILKALYRQARILILDEPTAVLAPSETRDLWAAVRRLSESGATVVFVTHKLDEVMANADTVTVLRRGHRILCTPTVETNPAALAEAMIGQAVSSEAVSGEQEKASAGGVVLSVRDLTVRGNRGEEAVRSVSLEVRAGEIVGLAGVDGSGQTELVEAIMGLRPIMVGEVRLADLDVTRWDVAKRREAGIGYIPDDRHHRAVALGLPCEENAIQGRQHESAFSGGGWLKMGAVRDFLRERAAAFDVRGAAVGLPIRSLSGGNQQKLVLARELSRKPQLLLAAQPTRGLDFGATDFVHRTLLAERDRGAAILLQSLDLAEILALSDRVAVLYAGKIVAILDRADATDGKPGFPEARVGALMTGAGIGHQEPGGEGRE